MSEQNMKRQKFLIDMGESPEGALLMKNLDTYIKLLGWSRKRFYLMGAAAVINHNGDNPALVQQIADYIAGKHLPGMFMIKERRD